MNAVTIIEASVEPAEPEVLPALALPDDLDYSQWLWTGRKLAVQKRHVDWMLADWVAHGRAHFPDQIELALADVVDDDRHLKRLEKTARAFPPHLRDKALSFDHHVHVADMPVQEALPLLKTAREEHMSPARFRIEAMLRKVETGQILPREDDAEDDAIMLLIRAWNRAPRAAREDFAELVAESHLNVIDPSGKMK